MGQLSQTQNLVSESYLRDEEEGSGSGQQPIDGDDEEEPYEFPHQGSGSGYDGVDERSMYSLIFILYLLRNDYKISFSLNFKKR